MTVTSGVSVLGIIWKSTVIVNHTYIVKQSYNSYSMNITYLLFTTFGKQQI